MRRSRTAPHRPPQEPPRGRAAEENRALREVVTVYTQLSGLATQDTDVHSVIALIGDRLGVGAVVVDAEQDVLASAGPSLDAITAVHEEIKGLDLTAVLSASARTKRAMTLPGVDDDVALVVAPILLNDEIPAFLFTGAPADRDGGEDLSLLVTEHAAMICGIVMGRQRLVASAVGSARLDLVEALLLARDRTELEMHNWARHLGIDEEREHVVVTVALQPPEGGPAALGGEMAAYVERFLTSRTGDGVVARRDTEVVAIVPAGGAGATAVDDLMVLGRMCRDVTTARFPGSSVSVGVGSAASGIGEFARSYSEARLAVDTTARMTGLGGVVAFRDLGIQRLLLRVSDVADLRAFADDVLGGLIAHEQRNNTEYLGTLTAYFRENASPKRTASLLHMHPNTVSYRIRRVEEITGLSLSSYRDQLMIQVALEILNGLREGS